jgi:hypothetical protein
MHSLCVLNPHRTTECNLTADAFCCHVVRLFGQMSAMAIMTLHVTKIGKSMQFDFTEPTRRSRLRNILDKHAPKPRHGHNLQSSDTAEMQLANISSSRSDVSLSQANLGELAASASMHFAEHGSDARRAMASTGKELVAGITPRERKLLANSPDPVFACAQRIQRAILSRLRAGGMHAPPPIVSRIFQEMSSGLLFYNNATKMKEVPVPFPYVQINAFLLNTFAAFLCPFAIASFTTVAWLSILTTAVTVISFYAIFMVANEMEDPFGDDANDMPMLEYHREFCASLRALLTSPWLPEDQWLVPSGDWVNPRTVTIAANIFGDKSRNGRWRLPVPQRAETMLKVNTALQRRRDDTSHLEVEGVDLSEQVRLIQRSVRRSFTGKRHKQPQSAVLNIEDLT